MDPGLSVGISDIYLPRFGQPGGMFPVRQAVRCAASGDQPRESVQRAGDEDTAVAEERCSPLYREGSSARCIQQINFLAPAEEPPRCLRATQRGVGGAATGTLETRKRGGASHPRCFSRCTARSRRRTRRASSASLRSECSSGPAHAPTDGRSQTILSAGQSPP